MAADIADEHLPWRRTEIRAVVVGTQQTAMVCVPGGPGESRDDVREQKLGVAPSTLPTSLLRSRESLHNCVRAVLLVGANDGP